MYPEPSPRLEVFAVTKVFRSCATWAFLVLKGNCTRIQIGKECGQNPDYLLMVALSKALTKAAKDLNTDVYFDFMPAPFVTPSASLTVLHEPKSRFRTRTFKALRRYDQFDIQVIYDDSKYPAFAQLLKMAELAATLGGTEP